MPIICPICKKPMVDGICFNCGYDYYKDSFNADIFPNDNGSGDLLDPLDDILDPPLDPFDDF